MPEDLTRRAAEMLLSGATLQGEPCPYCGGVRVIKDGHALCVGCGREPEPREIPESGAARVDGQGAGRQLGDILESKLESLAKDLEAEADPQRQKAILDSINAALEALAKTKAGSG